MKTSTQLSSYLAQFLEREMFRTKGVEKFKTHILCLVTFFANRVVYEVMWQNTAERGRSQMAICCMSLHVGYLRLQTHNRN